MSKTGLVTSLEFKKHQTGIGHPETPRRIEAAHKGLSDAGVMEKLVKIEPRPATREDILRVHSADYIETASKDVDAGLRNLSTGDTAISSASYDVALLAAGSIIAAVDAVLEKRVDNCFCIVRPPGHHATPTRGMGFCLFNNIAVAARYAQAKHGLKRVLIVDWDVHHGNGTQDVFYEDDTVLFFDTHQHPLYPGTGFAEERGAGKGEGFTINNPFPAGSGRREILGAFEKKLLPAVKDFKPDLVMISAGFDSREGDPLGGFTLKDEDFADLTRLMKGIAKDHAGGRVVSVMEGGYNLEGLGKACAAHAAALLE